VHFAGVNYATKLGFQSLTVANILNYLSGTYPAHWDAASHSELRAQL
jgi:hypothetical protein